jgi:hypothetical protein
MIDAGARARFRSLLDDYQVAQAVRVAADLGLADLLARGPRSSDDLASATGAHPRSLLRLLRALARLDVVTRLTRAFFDATPLTACLTTEAPDERSIRALPGGLPHEREAWEHLRYSVMTGKSAFRHLHGEGSWEYHERHPDLGENLHAGMSRGTRQWAGSVVAAYDFAGVDCVVDVGGGRGALLAAVLQAHPRTRGVLFDRPSVVRAAGPLLEAAGVADRCEIVGGDFFAGVPAGGDLYLTKSILHNWEDDAARRILRKCRAVMPSAGRLVLVEPVLDPDNPEQREMLFMDLHMLVVHGAGERTADEFSALLDSAGFRLTRVIPTDMMGSVIEAVPT